MNPHVWPVFPSLWLQVNSLRTVCTNVYKIFLLQAYRWAPRPPGDSVRPGPRPARHTLPERKRHWCIFSGRRCLLVHVHTGPALLEALFPVTRKAAWPTVSLCPMHRPVYRRRGSWEKS